MNGPRMWPYHDWKNNAWVRYAVLEKGLKTISPLGCWWQELLLNPIKDNVQYLTQDCDGVDSPDVAFVLAVPIVWLAWHLKLLLSILVACVHTHTNCWLVGELMLNQIASLEGPEPKSTWTSRWGTRHCICQCRNTLWRLLAWRCLGKPFLDWWFILDSKNVCRDWRKCDFGPPFLFCLWH